MTSDFRVLFAGCLALCVVACSEQGDAPSELHASQRPRASLREPMLLDWSLRCPPAALAPLPFRVESNSVGPLDAAAVHAAACSVLLPLRLNEQTLFREAVASEPAIVIGWRAGDHGDCAPFLEVDGDLAHSGPTPSSSGALAPSFIHLNPDFNWDRANGPDLRSTILHEALHFFGLGHAAEPAAVMWAGFGMEQRRSLHPADQRALIAALGMSGSDGPALVLSDPRDQRIVQVIPLSADQNKVRHAVLDVEADGNDEILLFAQTGSSGGELMLLRFGSDARLLRTQGPVPGALDARLDNEFTQDAAGRAVHLAHRSDGRFTAAHFDATGLPTRTLSHGKSLRLRDGRQDLDGDARFDHPAPMTRAAPATTLRLGLHQFTLTRRPQ